MLHKWYGVALAVGLLAALISLGIAIPASADGTPTPLPYRIFLPIVLKDNAPAQPQTVIFQQKDGYAGTLDTYISSYTPTSAHGFEPLLGLRWDRGHATDAEAALVRWDTSSIPSRSRVLAATLSVYVTGRSNLNTMTFSAFRVLHTWEPEQANWYSATITLPWAQMGCNGIDLDRLGTADDSVTIPDVGLWVDLDVSEMAQAWVSNPSHNFGTILKPVGDGSVPSVRYEIASSKHPDPGLRPRLTITYITLPVPPPTIAPPTATPTSNVPTATATATVTPTPTWTPVPSWWDIDYKYRRQLFVQAAPGNAIAAGYAVSLSLDTGGLVATGKLQASLRDWRLVAWNGWAWAEIDRHVSGPAETWFRLQRPIAGASSDDLYYAYYGNPDETTAPLANTGNVFTFFDDFTTYDSSKWPAVEPTGVQVGGGVITVTAYNPSGGAADSCPGAYDCMLSRDAFGIGYQVEERAQHPDYIYGKQHDADQGFSDDGHTHEAKLRSYNTALFQRVNRDAGSNVVVQCCRSADTSWHIFRVARLNAGAILFQIDGSPVETSTTSVPQMALPVHIRAFSGEAYEQSRNVVDWIRVRPVVAVEPSVTRGNEETAIFTTPTP